ncbi:flagellar hook-associated protein [Candidatus Photodesmus blepharus]|uniref:Flagellar hook-associated protein 2 n=1 Tax=Candidatus Photodesmus blepharonis TaxID=1179155 RepID=A0A084CP08_9GAMM|nr:flagellar filament capping protein FliD [Candidatus Photodesmus blepharus]KEY91537.1 flagellar hook-associated protein [Candidatus Photodesmus blepharus]
MNLNPLGMAANIDLNSMVTKIVDAERLPKQKRIDREVANINSKISAYGQLKASLDTMKDLMVDFRQEKTFSARKAHTSDENVVVAMATTGAIAGQYTMNVLQLAKKHKIASRVVPQQEDRFGPGDLQIQLGNKRFLISIKNNSKLVDIAKKINGNQTNPGVQASIINENEGKRLVLTSNISGKENTIRVSAHTQSDNPLKKFEYKYEIDDTDPQVTKKILSTYQGMIQVQPAQNSEVIVDGIARLSSHNNIMENAINGINLTLKRKMELNEPPIKIDIRYNTQKVEKNIERFIAAYNQFHQTSKELSSLDPKTGQVGPLAGDNVAMSIASRLKKVFSSPILPAPQEIKSLTEFGITTTRQGTLEVNYSILNRKINDNFNKLKMFFGGNQGFARKIEDAIQNITGTSGAIRIQEKSLMEKNYRLKDDKMLLKHRMDNLEKRTHAQFTSMQNATRKMQYQLTSMMEAIKLTT